MLQLVWIPDGIVGKIAVKSISVGALSLWERVG
jgi:hypothetical protein